MDNTDRSMCVCVCVYYVIYVIHQYMYTKIVSTYLPLYIPEVILSLFHCTQIRHTFQV